MIENHYLHSMEEIGEIVAEIKTKEDFIQFLDVLIEDLQKYPKGWVNRKLDTYLGALQSWSVDMDDFYKNSKKPIPTNVNWKVFAEMLVASTIYQQADSA